MKSDNNSSDEAECYKKNENKIVEEINKLIQIRFDMEVNLDKKDYAYFMCNTSLLDKIKYYKENVEELKKYNAEIFERLLKKIEKIHKTRINKYNRNEINKDNRNEINKDNREDTVSEQVNRMYEMRKEKGSFCDKNFLYLYGYTNNVGKCGAGNKNITKEKVLTYEIHEKIEGFCKKEGEYVWSNEKIDELVVSLSKK
ncbi:hypothetical protein BDAP_001694 [Binucleata daphniae]